MPNPRQASASPFHTTISTTVLDCPTEAPGTVQDHLPPGAVRGTGRQRAETILHPIAHTPFAHLSPPCSGHRQRRPPPEPRRRLAGEGFWGNCPSGCTFRSTHD